MPTCYLICAGGSGARALESVVHLCAAGLGPDDVTVLALDPDATNGNITRTRKLVSAYRTCQEAFGGKLGKGLRYFATRFRSLAADGDLAVWSPVDTHHQFRDLLGYGNLNADERRVAELLFSQEELDMPLDVGFRGHPSLGAAALALLPLYGAVPPWDAFLVRLPGELAAGVVNVVIVGSVFGGTGASVFFPLAHWLKQVADGTPNAANLKIAAVALAPYFTFENAAADTATLAAEASDGAVAAVPAGLPQHRGGNTGPEPDASKFPLATRAATEFYQHLRAAGQWEFDAMYWLGDDAPMQVPRDKGGAGQKNAAHFIDLLAGLTCLDYFTGGAPVPKACYYAGPGGDEARKVNVVEWGDLPFSTMSTMNEAQVRGQLLRFVLANALHSEFFAGLLAGQDALLSRNPSAIPWYRSEFAKRGKHLNVSPEADKLSALKAFFAQRHLPWWRSVHLHWPGDAAAPPDRVHLFNMSAFPAPVGEPPTGSLDLTRARNLVYPDTDAHSDLEIDALIKATVKVSATPGASDGAPAYLARLALAADQYVSKVY
jgi:hypothetical protein